MSELKPCPFCGSDEIEYDNDVGPDDEGFWEWYACSQCGARADDIEAWNRRAPVLREETMVEVAEVLEALESWNQDVPIWSEEHTLDAALQAFRKVYEEVKP